MAGLLGSFPPASCHHVLPWLPVALLTTVTGYVHVIYFNIKYVLRAITIDCDQNITLVFLCNFEALFGGVL